MRAVQVERNEIIKHSKTKGRWNKISKVEKDIEMDGKHLEIPAFKECQSLPDEL